MHFRLVPTREAGENLRSLETDPSLRTQLKAVRKALGYMETNLRHPGLNTHKHSEMSRQHGFEVFESYAQQHTSGAYRIFWRYGSRREEIVVLAIVRRPD
jgi:hypothetical protein